MKIINFKIVYTSIEISDPITDIIVLLIDNEFYAYYKYKSNSDNNYARDWLEDQNLLHLFDNSITMNTLQKQRTKEYEWNVGCPDTQFDSSTDEIYRNLGMILGYSYSVKLKEFNSFYSVTTIKNIINSYGLNDCIVTDNELILFKDEIDELKAKTLLLIDGIDYE